MAIQFHPSPGTILICDFNRGFVEPEMTKKRPCLVVSPRRRRGGRTCTIVPFSTKKPRPFLDHHFKLTLDEPLSDYYSELVQWVKCDMVYSVSFDRLSPFKAGKDENGRRLWENKSVSDDALLAIRRCILYGIGINDLTMFE